MGLGRAARPARSSGGGARPRTCWSGRWRIRASGAACCRRPRTSRTWSTAWTGSPAALGGLTQEWRFDRMATVCHPGSGRVTAVVRRRSPSTTACRWRSARRGAGTARAWWRRPTTPPRNAGGAPWPTTSPSSRPRPSLDRFARVRGDTRLRATADGTATVADRRRRRAAARRCRRRRIPAIARPRARIVSRAGAGRPTAATGTRCHPSWPRATVTVSPARSAAQFIDIATATRDRDRPPPAGRRRGRGHGPRQRPRHRPRTRRAWPRPRTAAPAPPQGTHPTRPGRPSRRRRAARPGDRTDRRPPSTDARRHRPGRLRARRPRKEHPAHDHTDQTDHRPPTDRRSTAGAGRSLYQQLRGHLADAQAARRRRAPARRPRPGRTPKACP